MAHRDRDVAPNDLDEDEQGVWDDSEYDDDLADDRMEADERLAGYDAFDV